MEKLNFVKDGATRLPPGFRFQPTEEELVFQYLKRKVFSCHLPASIIPELNVSKFDPWDLPGDSVQERYFFSQKEPVKYPSIRATSCGYWKVAGRDTQIISERGSSHLRGIKKTLVFYRGKSHGGSRTNWVMHEYHLVNKATTPRILQPASNSARMEDWAVCRVSSRNQSNYKLERKAKKATTAAVRLQPARLLNFKNGSRSSTMECDSYSSSTSSSSSTGITQLASSSGSDHEESSAAIDSLPFVEGQENQEN